MIIKYIDTKVILCAVTKYSPYKTRATQIIGGFGEAYALRISKTIFENIKNIHKKRYDTYKYIFSKMNLKSCLGKRPADFYSLFKRGETSRDYLDRQHLIDMYDQIIIDMGIEDLEVLNEQSAKVFCDKTYEAIGSNKRHLGFIIDSFEENELIFENEYISDEKKLLREFKKEFKDPKYKLDLKVFAECIADGMNSNMDFEMIISSNFFQQDKEIRKIHTAIKRVYKQYYNDLIIPLYEAYGDKIHSDLAKKEKTAEQILNEK